MNWQPLAIKIRFPETRKSQQRVVCFKKERFDAKRLEGLRETIHSSGRTDNLRAFNCNVWFDFFPKSDICLLFFSCQTFAANHVRMVAWVSLLFGCRLAWIPVGWQIAALAAWTREFGACPGSQSRKKQRFEAKTSLLLPAWKLLPFFWLQSFQRSSSWWDGSASPLVTY